MRPRIFYYCYDANIPAGGEKHSYQHVDVLNRNGYEAYVLHHRPGARLTWFDNSTPVVDSKTFERLHDPQTDIVVVPEDLGEKMFAYSCRRVIFNKNVFNGFQTPAGARDPYVDPDTLGVLAVSDHNAKYLALTYPGVSIQRVYCYIRPDIFTPVSLGAKQRQIAYAFKSKPMVNSLHRMFRARATAGLNRGASWNWERLTSRTETEISQILKQSLIFVSLGVEEGLPRLPLEAMSCGCLVAAFRTGPVAEILPTGHGFEYGDLAGVLAWIESVIEHFPGDVARYMPLAEAGRHMATTFSAAQQAESVCAAWEHFLESA